MARQLGKVCIVGCAAVAIDQAARTVRIGDRTLAEGDLVTLDGNTGYVYAGAVSAVAERPSALLTRLAGLPGWTETLARGAGRSSTPAGRTASQEVPS